MGVGARDCVGVPKCGKASSYRTGGRGRGDDCDWREVCLQIEPYGVAWTIIYLYNPTGEMKSSVFTPFMYRLNGHAFKIIELFNCAPSTWHNSGGRALFFIPPTINPHDSPPSGFSTKTLLTQIGNLCEFSMIDARRIR